MFSSKLNMEKRFKSAPFINNHKYVLYSECALFSVKEILEALKWRDQVDKQEANRRSV